jgi:hypothetical protein
MLDDRPSLHATSPPTLVAADLLLGRLGELRSMLTWYLAAVERTARDAREDCGPDLF